MSIRQVLILRWATWRWPTCLCIAAGCEPVCTSWLTAARSLYSKCIGRVALGSPATQIVRQSQALKADLIAVPLPLDLIRWCWLPEELLDELVRKADCPVLCVPAQKFHPEELPTIEELASVRPARPVVAPPRSAKIDARYENSVS